MATRPHVLVVGGAYAGVSTVQNMLGILSGKGCLPSPFPTPEVKTLPSVLPIITILDQRDGLFHTMGAPLAHASAPYAGKAWRRFDDIPELKGQGVRILQGTATSANLAEKVLTFRPAPVEGAENPEKQIGYDYLVAATGLQRTWPIVPREHKKERYLEDAREFIKELENVEGNIVVVGGGAVGVEIAAEVKHFYPSKHVILVHSRDELLSSEPLSEEFKESVKTALGKTGVEVLLGRRVTLSEPNNTRAQTLSLSTGETLQAEKVIFSTAKPAPHTEYLPKEALDEHGFAKVNPAMSLSANIPHNCCHFAVGDVAAWPGIKGVGGALIMGQAAAVNIIKKMVAKEQQAVGTGNGMADGQVELPPFPAMMSISVGEEGVALGPDGSLHTGKQVKEMSFGEDLGLSRTWEGLGLAADTNVGH